MFADLIVGAIVAVAFGLSLRKVISGMKHGGCNGCGENCGSCGQKCHTADRKKS